MKPRTLFFFSSLVDLLKRQSPKRQSPTQKNTKSLSKGTPKHKRPNGKAQTTNNIKLNDPKHKTQKHNSLRPKAHKRKPVGKERDTTPPRVRTPSVQCTRVKTRPNFLPPVPAKRRDGAPSTTKPIPVNSRPIKAVFTEVQFVET